VGSEGAVEQTESSSAVPLSPESLPFTASPPHAKASKSEIIDLDAMISSEPAKQTSPVRQTVQSESVRGAQKQADPIDLDEFVSPSFQDSSALDSGRGKDEEEEEDEVYRNLAAAARRRANQNKSAVEANPVISILIEPRIPNTLPLMVQRLYQQNFKAVRLAWCKHNIERNLLDPSQESDVIFTWRGRKIFDVQSCKSLGLGLDVEGLPTLEDVNGIPQLFDKVAIQATTEKIESEERRNKLANKAAVTDEPASSPQQPVERQYRVILRSRDYADQKIIVKEVWCPRDVGF
jgi:hypothetical protein